MPGPHGTNSPPRPFFPSRTATARAVSLAHTASGLARQVLRSMSSRMRLRYGRVHQNRGIASDGATGNVDTVVSHSVTADSHLEAIVAGEESRRSGKIRVCPM